MGPFLSTYSGIVEADNDPFKVGRLKIRVPVVYGPTGAPESIATNDLPWAMPVGLPAGGSPESGAMQWLPKPGDQVYVRFLEGEPEQPIWEYGGQNLAQAKAFPYWTRPGGGYNADGTAPNTAYLTRYTHFVEWAPGYLRAQTGGGYALRLVDSTTKAGQVVLVTAKGYTNVLDDAADTGTYVIPHHVAKTTTWTATATEVLQINTPLVQVQSPQILLGTEASDPVVRKSDLAAALATIMAWANSHVHGGCGGPVDSAPTVEDLSVQATASANTFSV